MVFAIVVLYNPNLNLLYKQHNSLINQVDQIIYIENGRNDWINYEDILSDKDIIIKRNENNLGLGVAQNQGIKIAIENNADFVFLLDQDSILPDSLVDTLVESHKSLESKGVKVAAVCPCVFSDFTKEISNVPISLGLKVKTIKPKSLIQVSYAISSGSLISKDAIKAIGGIQEDFFIDSMDTEWCLRADALGYKTFIEPKTTIIHQLGNGENNKVLQHSSFREYYIIRNSIAMIKLSYVPIGFRIRRLVLSVSRVLYSLFHGYWGYFFCGVKGLFSGWFVNTKKYIYGS